MYVDGQKCVSVRPGAQCERIEFGFTNPVGTWGRVSVNNKRTTPKNIVNCFTKHFTNTVRHETHKTNRSIQKYKDIALHSQQLGYKR